jgi:cytochrome P450
MNTVIADQTAVKTPPNVPGLPFVGSLFSFRDAAGIPVEFMTQTIKQYGDVVSVQIAGRQLYLVADPDLIHDIMVSRVNEFHKPIAGTPEPRSLNRFLGQGILTSDHDVWRPQRKLIQPLMHAKHIESYAETITRFGEKLLSLWENGAERDIWHDMTQVTMWIIAEAMFGMDATNTAEIEHAAKIAQEISVQELTTPLPKFLMGPTNRRAAEANQIMDNLVEGFVAERQSHPDVERHDLMSLLLNTKDEDGQPVSREFVRNNILTLFFAGHETTANTLTWAFYHLDRHPEVRAKLQQEVDTVLGGRIPTLDDLKNLPYTQMVIKETMRIEPIVSAISRFVADDLTLGDYQLQGNSMVIMPIYTLHRDPRWWSNPEQFDPMHFSPENEAKTPKFAYIPFGAGPRVCIGNHFAMMEAQLLLAMFVNQYEMHRETEAALPLIRHVTTSPKDGLKMRLTHR